MLIDINFTNSVYYLILFIVISCVLLAVHTGNYSYFHISIMIILMMVVFVSLNYLLPINSKCSIEKFEMNPAYKTPTIESSDKDYANPTNPDLIEKNKRDAEASAQIKANYKYDMKYDNGNPLNTIPLGENPYKNDYVYLPPSNWLKPFERPPVCVTDKKCPVCPGYTTGTNAELLTYEDSNHIVPPINIDVQYINK